MEPCQVGEMQMFVFTAQRNARNCLKKVFLFHVSVELYAAQILKQLEAFYFCMN